MVLFYNVLFKIYNCCYTCHVKLACALGSVYAPGFFGTFPGLSPTKWEKESGYACILYTHVHFGKGGFYSVADGYFMIQGYSTLSLFFLWCCLCQRHIILIRYLHITIQCMFQRQTHVLITIYYGVQLILTILIVHNEEYSWYMAVWCNSRRFMASFRTGNNRAQGLLFCLLWISYPILYCALTIRCYLFRLLRLGAI